MHVKFSSRFWLFGILVAAFALRLYRLGVASLWYDETISTFLAQQDLLALTRHTAGDIHPPLYYYLLHFWGQFAGWSEFSGAFFSLFFGIVLLALVHRVAREWFGPRVALIAAFLIAISPYNLWYSQEVRMYTLGATLGLASVYFFVRLFAVQIIHSRPPTGARQSVIAPHHSSPPTRDLIAYAIVSALGLYTLYYLAFLLVFENLVALLWVLQISDLRFRNLWSATRIWLLSQLAILVLYIPWVPIAFRQSTDPPVPPWRSFTPLPNVLLESFSALALGQSVDPVTVFPILLIVALVIAFALWADRRRHAADIRLPSPARNPLPTCTFLLGYTLVPLLVIYGLSLWKPLYHVRYIFTYSPGFYLLLAIGVYKISRLKLQIPDCILRFTSCTLIVLLTAASIYSAYNFWFDPKYAHDDLRGAARYVAEHWRLGDAVLVNAGYTYTAFVYYYPQPIAWRGRLTDYMPHSVSEGAVVVQTGSIDGGASLGWGDPRSDFYATTAEETRTALDRVFAVHPRVWQFRLYDTVVDPQGFIRDYLAQHGRIIDDQGFRGESYARVQGYLTTPVPLTALPAGATRREVLLGNRITLLGFEPATARVCAGASLDVTLYWQAREPTNVDQHLFVGLYADDGKLVASSDEVPLGNALGTSRWSPGEIMREPIHLTIPANVTPGNYVVRVAMYNPLTNEALEARLSEWVVEESQIRLTDVSVAQ